MDDAILSYYNRELTYIRKLGAEFSERHPKVAGRIRLDKELVEDPHVSRLIESFAFLTARIRHTIDDSFPELTESLMGLLYPDYHAPIPSMSLVQFRAIPEVAQMSLVEKGRLLRAETASMGACYFQTCYDTTTLPVQIENVQFANYPVKAPTLPSAQHRKSANKAVLKMSVSPFDDVAMSDFSVPSLRFYINAQPHIAFKLHEYLLNNLTGIALARKDQLDGPDTVFLSPNNIQACGFDEDDKVIPFDGRTSAAHRLLAEYFTFPQKFLFFTLNELARYWEKFSEGFNLYFYFDQTHAELIQGVGDETLLLGCTPIVNLYEQQTQTIDASETGIESKLKVSDTYSKYADVHSVKTVYARNSEGKNIPIKPFYGSHLKKQADEENIYWYLRRENSQYCNGVVSHGTDTYISFVDENFKALKPGNKQDKWLINATVRSTNRDVSSKLPFGPGQPKISFMEGGAGLRLNCLSPPTTTISPELGDATRWQLATQLSLQSFSQADGLQVLKDLLQLYDYQKNQESRSIFDGIRGLTTETTTARLVQQGRSCICQGTRIVLDFDEQYYSGSGLYLFSGLLNEFFSQYCSMNSFTQLSVNIKQRPGNAIEWPPRNGKLVLV
jgi:type VI secretion system protein ImpG